jgi:hypothetical protein
MKTSSCAVARSSPRAAWSRCGSDRAKPSKLRKLVDNGAATTPEGLVKAFQEDTERKRMMIRKTEATRNRLVFIVEALSQLSNDESFVALLEDEGLESMPNRVAERIQNVRITSNDQQSAKPKNQTRL